MIYYKLLLKLQIIEAMPLDGKVEEFMSAMGPFYEFVELDKKNREVVKGPKKQALPNGAPSSNHLYNGLSGWSC